MICGNCKERHASAEDVRACYGNRAGSSRSTRARGDASGRRRDQVLADPVPAGRYAVQLPDDRVHFFLVDKPDAGKWKGWTFLKEQAGDDLHPVKSADRRELVFEKIGEDIPGASRRYGLLLGKCGVCGRTLTNEESRLQGIGPVCSGKMGWDAEMPTTPTERANQCSPGQKCDEANLRLCSKHSQEYQSRYGRAYNE